jgi:RNA-directed DNA polymerase
VTCWSARQAEQALERLTALLADLGLEPEAGKIRIVRLCRWRGLDFLGLHHRLVRSRVLNGTKLAMILPAGPRTRQCSTPVARSGN